MLSGQGTDMMLETTRHSLIHRTSSIPTSRFCLACGLTLTELRERPRVGCGNCYDAFGDLLSSSIERLHGSRLHPRATPTPGLMPPSVLPNRPFEEFDLDLDHLAWLSHSSKDEVVISSRLRLARNLAGYAFPDCAQEKSLEEVRHRVFQAISDIEPGWGRLFLEDLSSREKRCLLERHLLTPGSLQSSCPGLACSPLGRLAVLINEEDHLRLQSLSPGFNLTRDLPELERLTESLERSLNFCQHARYGYLTACPSNLGSGLRASVLLHLPALSWLEALPEVARKVTGIGGLLLRGPYGESSPLGSPFLQLSNQVSLGRQNRDLVSKVETAARLLIDWEKQARAQLQQHHIERIEDAVWRAAGLLSHAQLLDHTEFLEQVSLFRLGQLLGRLPVPTKQPSLARLLVESRPSHLGTQDKTNSSSDRLRARWARKQFQVTARA